MFKTDSGAQVRRAASVNVALVAPTGFDQATSTPYRSQVKPPLAMSVSATTGEDWSAF
jgi:hypothetical protein